MRKKQRRKALWISSIAAFFAHHSSRITDQSSLAELTKGGPN